MQWDAVTPWVPIIVAGIALIILGFSFLNGTWFQSRRVLRALYGVIKQAKIDLNKQDPPIAIDRLASGDCDKLLSDLSTTFDAFSRSANPYTSIRSAINTLSVHATQNPFRYWCGLWVLKDDEINKIISKLKHRIEKNTPYYGLPPSLIKKFDVLTSATNNNLHTNFIIHQISEEVITLLSKDKVPSRSAKTSAIISVVGSFVSVISMILTVLQMIK